jgi:hypothetical protein
LEGHNRALFFQAPLSLKAGAGIFAPGFFLYGFFRQKAVARLSTGAPIQKRFIFAEAFGFLQKYLRYARSKCHRCTASPCTYPFGVAILLPWQMPGAMRFFPSSGVSGIRGAGASAPGPSTPAPFPCAF